MEKCKAILARPACAIRSLLNKVNELVDHANLNLNADAASKTATAAASTAAEAAAIAERAQAQLDGAVHHAALYPCVGGNNVRIDDAAAKPLDDLRVFGKGEGSGAVGARGDMLISISGKNHVHTRWENGALGAYNDKVVDVDSASVRRIKNIFLVPGRYTLSGPSTVVIYATREDGTINWEITRAQGTPEPYSFTITENMYIALCGSAELETFQIEHDGMQTELSTPAQTIKVNIAGGLQGVPVTTGGNYTDENGQMWLCDELDFSRGVHIKRVGVEYPVETPLGDTVMAEYAAIVTMRGTVHVTAEGAPLRLIYRADNELYFK